MVMASDVKDWNSYLHASSVLYEKHVRKYGKIIIRQMALS